MSGAKVEVKVIEVNYYDDETCKQETSPVTIKDVNSWKSAKAFNPIKLNGLPAKTLVEALKKLF